MTRRLARISRQLVFRLSQYRTAGRNSPSTASGGSSTSASGGASASNPPDRMSSTGGATLYRRPTVVPTSTVTPSTMTRNNASTRTSCPKIVAAAALHRPPTGPEPERTT